MAYKEIDVIMEDVHKDIFSTVEKHEDEFYNNLIGEYQENIFYCQSGYRFTVQLSVDDDEGREVIIDQKLGKINVYDIRVMENGFSVHRYIAVAVYGGLKEATVILEVVDYDDISNYDEEIFSGLMKMQASIDLLIPFLENKLVRHNPELKKFLVKNLLGD